MINLQTGPYGSSALATPNVDADSAGQAWNKTRLCRRCYEQSDPALDFPNILSDKGRRDMTKPSALPLWQGWIPQSLGVGKLLKRLKN